MKENHDQAMEILKLEIQKELQKTLLGIVLPCCFKFCLLVQMTVISTEYSERNHSFI